ncbi:hypothetical protein SDC9_104828 [bioreactor metagenome]|uniref:Uncharacterized protein n=1 Tax=bioreactor metagenome TaxID=1076179 RepID=A0A645AXZ9_9ZZZZ
MPPGESLETHVLHVFDYRRDPLSAILMCVAHVAHVGGYFKYICPVKFQYLYQPGEHGLDFIVKIGAVGIYKSRGKVGHYFIKFIGVAVHNA